MKHKHILTTLLTLVLAATDIAAQNSFLERYNVSFLDLKTGLPHNNINDIFADSNGFVWVSTYGGGLVRYDGYGFMTPIQPSAEAMRSNSCHNVVEDAHHRLWITFDEGTSVVSLETMQPAPVTPPDSAALHSQEHPSPFTEPGVRVYRDTKDAIWLITMPAIYRITLGADGNIDHFCRYQYIGNTPNITIRDIEGNGSAWLNIDGGLYRLTEREGKLVRESIAPAMQQLSGRYVTDILKRQDIIWFSTNEGLFAYDTTTEQMTSFVHTPQPGALSHSFTTCLAVTPQNQLLVGSLCGMNILNDATGTFTHWTSATGQLPLNSDFVHRILVRDGLVWIGTETGGIVKMVPRQLRLMNYAHTTDAQSLSPNPVNAMYVEPNGTLWVGTVEGGLNRKPFGQHTFTHLTTTNSALSHNSVSALEADVERRLWIGTWGGGVNVVHLDNPGEVRHLDFGEYTRETNYIGALAYDQMNNGLWIGSNDGIFFYDLTTEKITDPFEVNRQLRGCVGALIDRHGYLWMGCTNGAVTINLNQRNLKSGTFEFRGLRYKLDRPESGIIDKISCFCETQDGTLWLGSNGYGIYKRVVDENGHETFECLTTDDGLGNNAVKGIVEDGRQRLWITTSNGLSIYDTRAGTFINYTEKDGLLSSQFYWNSAVKGENGLIYLGSERGLTEVYGENQEGRNGAHLHFTRLLVDNQEVRVGNGDDYLDKDISVANTLRLSESNRSFTIEFSALNYSTEMQGVYSYRMKNFDNDWTVLKAGEHSVRYSTLPSGSYTFEVKYTPVMTSDEEQIIALNIRVKPYFWKSWWFIALCLIILAAILTYVYNRRVQELRRREAEKQLQPIRKALEDSDDAEQLQKSIQKILDNQVRFRESMNKNVEADKQEALLLQKPFMERVIEVIEQNYSNSEFGVTEFCEAIGMSRSVVSKRLNAETGQSTGQYIRSYRLNIAKELLTQNQGNRNITEIAYKVGFNDPKYFTRCFTKIYGVSPSTFIGDNEKEDEESE